jgi:hypothetical protein
MTEYRKRQLNDVIGIVGGVLVALTSLNSLISDSIPYTYHSTLLDTIDYVAGRNVFHRKGSLMGN